MPPDLGPFPKRALVEGRLGDADTDVDADKTPDVQKDEQVWFSDGNVVVVAAKKVAFQVHKGILSLRSEVFRDLFALANADTATAETMDGCPVVHLTDPPEDIRYLFLVLCCGKNYYYDGDAPIPVPFSVLAALVRTAHHYAIPDVLADALARLKKFYTNDLAAWQDPASRARYVVAANLDAPTAVNLARLTGTLTVLPTALLVCTQLNTLCVKNRAYGSYVLVLDALSVQDHVLVNLMKVFLMQARGTRAFQLLGTIPSAQCTTRERCEAARCARLTADARNPFLSDSWMTDKLALTPMAKVFWAPSSHCWHKFCASCKAALVEKDEMLIRLLWHHLPGWLRLEIDEDSWPATDGSVAEPEGQ